MNNSGLSAADIAAVTGNDNRGGFFGGDGSWFLIILFLFAILGWGGNGWGGGNAGYGGGGFLGAELQRGFDQQNVVRKLDEQTYGIADATYALNNAITGGFHNTTVGMMQGFNGVERSMCDLSRQLSDCCCENRAAIADLKYTVATESCATRNAMQMNTRDIIENANANSRAILDFLTENKIESLRAENAALRQNQFIVQVGNDIVNRLNPPAIPSYVVPNPNCCYNANVTLAHACGQMCG